MSSVLPAQTAAVCPKIRHFIIFLCFFGAFWLVGWLICLLFFQENSHVGHSGRDLMSHILVSPFVPGIPLDCTKSFHSPREPSAASSGRKSGATSRCSSQRPPGAAVTAVSRRAPGAVGHALGNVRRRRTFPAAVTQPCCVDSC